MAQAQLCCKYRKTNKTRLRGQAEDSDATPTTHLKRLPTLDLAVDAICCPVEDHARPSCNDRLDTGLKAALHTVPWSLLHDLGSVVFTISSQAGL